MNAMLKKLEKLLRSLKQPSVICIDTVHVRTMLVVEDGTPEQMKQCLLNLPITIPLYGTVIMNIPYLNSSSAFSCTGTVSNVTRFYWENEARE